MPISVSTFAPGAVIDAAQVRSRSLAIERYVNGDIVAGDRTTNWVSSGHVYGPDFQYGAGYDAHLPLSGGHVYWSKRPSDAGHRAIFSYQGGTAFTMVPGLTRTIQIPEALTDTRTYRVLVLASCWVYEYGGSSAAGPLTFPYQAEDEAADGAAAHVGLYADGVLLSSTQRSVLGSSCSNTVGGDGSTSGIIYCRKQVSMLTALTSGVWSGAGIHTIGVGVACDEPPLAAPNDRWRHVFVQEGSIHVRYRLR
jgi:hypothetical protein